PYDPNAPLPSYDLEEISAVEAMALSPQATGEQTGAPGAYPAQPPLAHAVAGASGAPFATAQLDDPFANEPLPSFPMEEEATQFIHAPRMHEERAAAAPIAQQASPPTSRSPLRADGPHAHAQLDEDALEEIEFFSSHGMFEEAHNLLDEQL